ncbi:MAG: hypothetical protein IKL13_02065 [Clostridia bacterium]|nr:hypothetical protein [Clostridia bacterium]
MEQRTREEFTRLYQQCRSGNADDRHVLIAYLRSLVAKGEVSAFEDIGFCYWNISDQYALLRDGHSQAENHRRFYEHVSQGDDRYLYWLTNDATQKLTLEKDGYGDLWWGYYREAVERNATKDLPIECGVHRAALYKNPLLPVDDRCVLFAKQQFEDFLSRAQETEEYAFYCAMYLSSVAQYEAVEETILMDVGQSLLGDLSAERIPNDFLIGEWSKFATSYDHRRRAEVGIYAVVNALIDTKHTECAKVLYTESVSLGLPKNLYIERRL